LLVQSVISRAVVAAGAFAPGHLGELTQFVPFELVDDVLAQTRRVQRRVRDLPARVVVYFLLAMCLFDRDGYEGVWARMVAGLAGYRVAAPTGSALRQARRRLGVAPLAALFDVLRGPVAARSTPGVWWGRWRLVAFDGTTVAVPDSAANRAVFGKHSSQHGTAGYPLMRLVTFVECGTRALLGAVFGPTATGESKYALTLMGCLTPQMLVLADQGLSGKDLLQAIDRTGAQWLIRITTRRRLPVLRHYGDGSYLTMIAGLRARIVAATLTVTAADGRTHTGQWLLATSLLNPAAYPATALVTCYHQRWEIESSYLELKQTILSGRVLRSHTPTGLTQEVWALLIVYQILRTAIVHGVETTPGIDPDRASFTTALHTARDQITLAAAIITTTVVDLAGQIGRAVLANLLPDRRHRTRPRTVKRPLSRYAYKKPGASTLTGTITINVKINPPAH
jgi:hypothetical protein